MAKTVTATLDITLNATHKNIDFKSVSGRSPADKVQVLFTSTLATGTGAGQADMVYQEQGTIAGAATKTFDLAGSLVDAFGATLTFARLKGLIHETIVQGTDTLAHVNHGPLGNGAPFLGPFANASDGSETRVGGITVDWCADATGWAVTATTGDIWSLTNKHATQVAGYRFTAIGASA